jgi:hypothetical protein
MNTEIFYKDIAPTVVVHLAHPGAIVDIPDGVSSIVSNIPKRDSSKFYAIEWDGTPGDSNPSIVRKDQAEIDAIIAAQEAQQAAASQAAASLDTEYQNTGFATIDVAGADAYVDSELPANVTDLATAREAIIGLRDICNKQNRMLIWMREEIKKRL